MLGGSHKYLHWVPYLFFHIYDRLSNPCLADMFVFRNTYEDLSQIHKYCFSHLATICFLSLYDSLNIPSLAHELVFAHVYKFTNILTWKTYLLCHLYDHLNILCFAVIFGFANSYEVLCNSRKYFTFGSQIFFTSMSICMLFNNVFNSAFMCISKHVYPHFH